VSQRKPLIKPRLADGLSQAVFLLPALILFSAFIVYPAATSVYYSFTDWSGISKTWNMVGFQNYKFMFSDSGIFRTLPVTLYYCALNAVMLIAVAFFAALALNRVSKITGVLRVSFFLPMLVAPLTVGFIFKEFYGAVLDEHTMGTFNRILTSFGLKSLRTNWLGNPNSAMLIVVITGVWYQVGTTALIYLANMQVIPKDLYEAARIDGAGYWRQVYHITWKMIAPALRVNVILLLINSLKTYDLIAVLTAGGPGTATKVISLSIVEFGPGSYKVALGCAMSTVVTVFVFILVTAAQKLLSKLGAD